MSKKEKAVNLAAAIVDYAAARDVHYSVRTDAVKRAYDNLVKAIESAIVQSNDNQ